MTGWKTWCGVISAFLTGFGLVAHGAAGEHINVEEISLGFVTISGAITALGIGHKVEKASDKLAVVIAGKPVVVATDILAAPSAVGAGESVVAKPAVLVVSETGKL